MKNMYDVIVIGAGNGGLAAAATAAKHGLKTLLLERNSVPGGCATSFRRGRFEFEAALHELANVGTEYAPGSIRTFFEDLHTTVNWHTEDTLFRVIADGENGYDAAMPAGAEAFCRELERQAPGSYDGAAAVLECAKKANAAVAYLASGKPDPAVLLSEHADFLRMASHSVTECFDALGMPQKAKQILCTYWPYVGASPDETDFAYYVMLLERYVLYRPALPQYRSHELSLALEKSIRDYGGEIRYHTEVSEILVNHGRAYGVIARGEEILASHIISNCHPDTVYRSMIKSASVPEQAKKLSNAREPGLLFFNVYLGLNRSAESLGIKDYSVFLFASADSREQYMSCSDSDQSFVIGNCLNIAVLDASPRNTCLLSLTTMLTEHAWGELLPADYKKVKNRIAGRMIATYEQKLGVRLQPYIEEIVIAAPPTFARYLNTPNGTPYGYHIKSWDTMLARMMNAKSERFIENLYFTGAHAERTAGYSCAYASGCSTAEKICREATADVHP